MLEITAKAQELSESPLKTPQLIIDIDGITKSYSLVDSSRIVRYGDGHDYGDQNLYYGKPAIDLDVEPIITLDGTTTNIDQQIDPISATTSIQNMSINLIDIDGDIGTEFYNTDIFTAKANVYLSFKNLEHPKDSIRIFSGLVNGIEYGTGSIKLKIDNPEYLKTQELFPEVKTKLTSAITDTDTTINVESTAGYILTQDALTSYIRIEDEIILVTGITSTSFTGCTRGQLGTIAVTHDNGTDVNNLYRLEGNAIELALKLYLSSDDVYYETLTPIGFVDYSLYSIPDAIHLNYVDSKKHFNITPGDAVDILGSTSNDGAYTVISYGQNDDNTSYITVSPSLTSETPLGTISLKSKYNTLPVGCSMLPSEVDIAQHELIYDNFLLNSPGLDFRIETSKIAEDFINTELYKVIGSYPLPRNGQSSIGYTSPPIASGETVFLNEDNIKNPFKIKINRTVKENFYNNVIYKYEHDVIQDKFLSINQTISADSVSKYRTGNQPLNIESFGMINNPTTSNFIESASRRLLDRYRYGAEYFSIDVLYGAGFRIEAGDTVVVDGTKISLYDSKTGLRNTFYRVMEVVNKKLNIKSGSVTLDLVDTAFQTVGRYFSVSPSAVVTTGSVATNIRLEVDQLGQSQGSKFAPYVGANIIVRSTDYTTSYQSQVVSYSASSPDNIEIADIGVTPTAGWVVEFDAYDNQTAQQKTVHGCITDTVAVVSGISGTALTVGAADIGKFFVGGWIDVRSTDFTKESNRVQISSIVNNDIFLSDDLGFTPTSTDLIEFIGFSSDSGDAYIIL